MGASQSFHTKSGGKSLLVFIPESTEPRLIELKFTLFSVGLSLRITVLIKTHH